MNRRSFVTSTAGAGVLSSAMPAAEAKKAIIEMRWFRMRNMPSNQVQRTQEFLSKQYMPAAKRAGAGTMGFFSGVISSDSPSILAVTNYPSFAAYGDAIDKFGADKDFQAAAAAFAGPDLPYMRMEVSLLRAFDSVPQIEIPPATEGRGGHIFELRTYESNTMVSLAKKIEMFDRGEVAIFRKTGLIPVFFGAAVAGRNLPNLTYMVAFDDMAGREQAWRNFGADPDWKKLRAMPGYADAEIVSNITNSILRGLPFSQIR